jgi:hypothetical protein
MLCDATLSKKKLLACKLDKKYTYKIVIDYIFESNIMIKSLDIYLLHVAELTTSTCAGGEAAFPRDHESLLQNKRLVLDP